MTKKITASDLAKVLIENSLQNGKGMKSTFVNHTLMRCPPKVLLALKRGCDHALNRKEQLEAQCLISQLKLMSISEEDFMKMYKEV